MATEEDKDPAIVDWGEQANTTLDAAPLEETPPEVPTAPHRTLGPEIARAFEDGREAGFRAGFPKGQDDAIEALEAVFAQTEGGVDASARLVVARVRAKLTAL